MARSELIPAVSSIDDEIGRRIRLLREARRLPLASIAARIGKSIGFVSQVERGISSLAVRELVMIAELLGVDLLALVAPPASPGEASPIRRAGTAPPAIFHPSGVVKHPLSPSAPGTLRLFRMVLEPGSGTGADLYSHEGEEAGLVIEGSIRLTIGADEYLLTAGDSFRFPSTTPHGFANAGTGRAVALWVNQPR